MFDGKAIRDEILKDLADKVVEMEEKPTMAVLLIGSDPICAKYVELKQKLAEKIGVHFNLYKFDEQNTEAEILECINFLNSDPETRGIMMQIPIPKKFDRDKLISAISKEKDIDGLRFCAGLPSNYRPPVVLAVLEAILRSGKKIDDKTKVVMLGRGFLVGAPLLRTFKENSIDPVVVLSDESKSKEGKSFTDAQADIAKADIIISAVGKASMIKERMVKEGVILIDAGTAEQNGALVGDIEPETYKKSLYYTPVPGGIGPVTVSMLFRNLLK
jgi:methylenetetrahydrofolate dehydrogenase (NADP+)/methenyltetrahydrofolate cyclohydrolase